MIKKLFWLAVPLAVLVISCTKVPVSNRRQVHLLPESQLIGSSLTAYDDFLSKAKVLPDSDPRARRVKEVGTRIQKATEQFLQKRGQAKRLEGFKWQFNCIEDSTVNAWCMPGGMVAVYTGIMELATDDDMLATVMGHEVAHAIARHGNERMSQQYGANLALSILGSASSKSNQQLLQMAGVGTKLGILKFSRTHESESDKLGLVFMSIAGYNPEKAVDFWERMSANGGSVPELLSTHPSDETRIADIKAFLPMIELHTK